MVRSPVTLRSKEAMAVLPETVPGTTVAASTALPNGTLPVSTSRFV